MGRSTGRLDPKKDYQCGERQAEGTGRPSYPEEGGTVVIGHSYFFFSDLPISCFKSTFPLLRSYSHTARLSATSHSVRRSPSVGSLNVASFWYELFPVVLPSGPGAMCVTTAIPRFGFNRAASRLTLPIRW